MPDPEGWLMKPSIRVVVTVKVDAALVIFAIATLVKTMI
jgi:hypothetical protein